jgi:hypothetical protein
MAHLRLSMGPILVKPACPLTASDFITELKDLLQLLLKNSPWKEKTEILRWGDNVSEK